MRFLNCIKPGTLAYGETEYPALQQQHSLIKIKRIGICGTDIHAYEGVQPYFQYPRILGHELSAEYVAGSAEGFAIGDKLTIIPYFHCGKCIACRRGNPNCCVNIEVCGVHRDGAFSEYLLVPDYSLVKGNGLNLEELALIEPLAIGAHAIRRANVRPDEFVLVVGAGPIGLGVMQFASIAGGKIIALDINEKRLRFCSEKLSVPHTLLVNEDIREQLMEITNGDMPTVIIDATGNKQAMQSAFCYMAHTARYVLVGLQKENINFSHPEFHKREATLMSSRNALRSDFEHVMSAMQQRLINPLDYITHRYDFNDVATHFGTLSNPDNAVVKAMIEMD